MAIFAHSILIDSVGTLSNINVIYTLLKSTFSGLRYCHWQ